MRNIVSFAILSVAVVNHSLNAAPKIEPLKAPGRLASSQSNQSGSSNDLEMIRSSATSFEEAYNNRDAKAVAAHFTEDADFFDEDGTQISGRDKIQKDYEDIFANTEPRNLSLEVVSIKMLSPTVAIEDGKFYFDPELPGPLAEHRYTAIHVKKDGNWLIKSVRDSRTEKLSDSNPLEELSWLVGEWVDESPDSLVLLSCKWSPNKKYLLREYTVQFEGRKELSGVQRIGWDPLTKRIKSWVFDSEGTLGEGIWNQNGNVWTVSSKLVLPDGTTASSINTYEYLDEDSYRWNSYHREAGGVSLEDITNITIIKRAPAPESN